MSQMIVNKTPALIVLCGPAGSGKSTWIKTHEISPKPVIISTDQLRKEWLGDESDQSQNPFIWERAMQQVQWYLFSNVVVFDATNLKKGGRRKLVEMAHRIKAKAICIYFNVSLDQCLENDRKRERHVPPDVIARQFEKYTYPTIEEGWDLIMEAGKTK